MGSGRGKSAWQERSASLQCIGIECTAFDEGWEATSAAAAATTSAPCCSHLSVRGRNTLGSSRWCPGSGQHAPCTAGTAGQGGSGRGHSGERARQEGSQARAAVATAAQRACLDVSSSWLALPHLTAASASSCCISGIRRQSPAGQAGTDRGTSTHMEGTGAHSSPHSAYCPWPVCSKHAILAPSVPHPHSSPRPHLCAARGGGLGAQTAS